MPEISGTSSRALKLQERACALKFQEHPHVPEISGTSSRALKLQERACALKFQEHILTHLKFQEHPRMPETYIPICCVWSMYVPEISAPYMPVCSGMHMPVGRCPGLNFKKMLANGWHRDKDTCSQMQIYRPWREAEGSLT